MPSGTLVPYFVEGVPVPLRHLQVELWLQGVVQVQQQVGRKPKPKKRKRRKKSQKKSLMMIWVSDSLTNYLAVQCNNKKYFIGQVVCDFCSVLKCFLKSGDVLGVL